MIVMITDNRNYHYDVSNGDLAKIVHFFEERILSNQAKMLTGKGKNMWQLVSKYDCVKVKLYPRTKLYEKLYGKELIYNNMIVVKGEWS